MNVGPLKTIHLKVAPVSVPYLRNKPIHHTQHEENDEGTEITLKLIPNYELTQAILQFWNKIEILEPKSFRDNIKAILTGAVEIYSETNES